MPRPTHPQAPANPTTARTLSVPMRADGFLVP